MIADQPHAERNSRLHRIAHRGGHARIRHRHHQIRVHRMLARQLTAQRFAAVVHAASKNCAVRPREIYMLENAELERLLWREVNRLQSRLRNAEHLARLDFANILRIQQVKRASFAGHNPRGFSARCGEFCKVERTKSARVAHRIQFIRRQHHQRVCALALIQRIAQRA